MAAVVFVKLTDSRAAKMLQAMWLSKADIHQLLLLLLSLLLLFSPLLVVAKLQAVRLKTYVQVNLAHDALEKRKTLKSVSLVVV